MDQPAAFQDLKGASVYITGGGSGVGASLTDGFMAQGGDPTGTGTGGSSKPNLKAEVNSEPHIRGVCSMARSGHPDSANSQFFICFDDARFLDRQYTAWGRVIEGMENVGGFKILFFV